MTAINWQRRWFSIIHSRWILSIFSDEKKCVRKSFSRILAWCLRFWKL